MDYILAIATILGGLSAAWYFWDKFKSRKNATMQEPVTVSTQQPEITGEDSSVRRMIEEYHHLTIHEVKSPGIIWFDLASTGRDTEFAVLYSTESHEILDVFTTRQSGFENLFHRVRIDEELMPAFIVMDGHPYFICASRAGSGGFLDLELYTYDGIGKLSQVYHVGQLFQGDFWITDSRLFIAGGNQRFELRKEDGSFILVPYDKNLALQLSTGTHVLSIVPLGDHLVINYDGGQISFASEELSYRSTVPIKVQLEELIVVDDNLVETGPQSIRVLVDGTTFNFHRHFFYSIQPTRRGFSHIQISHNYGDWYFIDVAIE